ncbi:hypothetical protein [Mycolicibacterium mengxianglii]|uniref:hypothetical protein n=1 Tax=Mycolicibacterium mengxianglii TaxID=2736649 RepID=UPI0018D0579F|nr:hypothetical protein [Mycolicibacterium mengxianglii]
MKPDATVEDPDRKSAEWIRDLLNRKGSRYQAAVRRLHDLLLRAARHELRRRNTALAGVELDDLAHQAFFDSRRKILGFLVANDYVLKDTSWGGPS